MSESPKLSRLGLAVIKLKIGGECVFLMRRDHRWNDVSFVGGHELPRDNSSLLRAARRELLEEVPAFRAFKEFELAPLTGEVTHGPVHSASAGTDVKYALQFFHVQFSSNPAPIVETVSTRTANALLREDELRTERHFKVAEWVRILDRVIEGGLLGIPFSWREDLGADLRARGGTPLTQREMSFG
jgi:NUDIX domain